MNLIWHIVKKDGRHVRWLLAGWLAVFGLQVVLGIWAQAGSERFFATGQEIDAVNRIMIAFQLLGAMFLTGEIVQADLLVEPRAHWLALPISGARLLAAKLSGVILLVWLLPLVVLWPWWLVHHWTIADLAFGTAALVGLHALVTLPALLIASLTDSWTRFVTWLILFGLVLLGTGVGLLAHSEALRGMNQLNDTGSRAVAGFAVIVGVAAVVVVNQYLTRNRLRSLLAAGVGGLLAALTIVFWRVDFVAPAFATLTTPRLPATQVRLNLGPISGGARLLSLTDHLETVGVNVDGTVEGLTPGDLVVGLLRNVSWKWPNSGVWKPEVPSFYFSSTIPSFVNRPGNRGASRQELFPRQENIYSLGVPSSVPAYVVRRLLAEPTEFRAQAEMVVIHREVLAEVTPKTGNRFGQGAERFSIVSIARTGDSGNLVMVRTLPLLRQRDLYRFPAIAFGEMLFSKLVTRADGQIRATTYGNSRETQVGPFAGVFVSRIVYGISSPREYFRDRPKEQAVIIDPNWWDGFTVLWTQRRPVAWLETELVEPHFVTRVETPSRYPELRNSRSNP